MRTVTHAVRVQEVSGSRVRRSEATSPEQLLVLSQIPTGFFFEDTTRMLFSPCIPFPILMTDQSATMLDSYESKSSSNGREYNLLRGNTRIWHLTALSMKMMDNSMNESVRHQLLLLHDPNREHTFQAVELAIQSHSTTYRQSTSNSSSFSTQPQTTSTGSTSP